MPEVDGCVQDPASCLPDTPEVDPCLENPASCVPDTPDVDPCLENPASCVPDTPDVDKCANDPKSCLPAVDIENAVSRPSDDNGKSEDDDDDTQGGVPAGRDDDSRRRSDDQGSGRERRERDQAASAPVNGPTVEPSGIEASPLASAPAGEGTLDRIAEGVADAARRFAFPMTVAALAGLFLLVQGRLDRRDPKLAVAPVDSREDLVSFR